MSAVGSQPSVCGPPRPEGRVRRSDENRHRVAVRAGVRIRGDPMFARRNPGRRRDAGRCRPGVHRVLLPLSASAGSRHGVSARRLDMQGPDPSNRGSPGGRGARIARALGPAADRPRDRRRHHGGPSSRRPASNDGARRRPRLSATAPVCAVQAKSKDATSHGGSKRLRWKRTLRLGRRGACHRTNCWLLPRARLS